VTVVSPDGRDIWVDDLRRGTSTRLTDDGTSHFPAWPLDGARVFFSSGTPGLYGLYSRAADASDERATLLTNELSLFPFSWTPDGQALSFVQLDSWVTGSIWTVSPAGDRVPYLVTPFAERNPDLSPNGQWMAYQSDESGQQEVYIQRYPDPELGGKVTVSTGVGSNRSGPLTAASSSIAT